MSEPVKKYIGTNDELMKILDYLMSREVVWSECWKEAELALNSILSHPYQASGSEQLQVSDIIKDLEQDLYFYKKRTNMLQCWQSSMRYPERKIVCDILANGFTLTTKEEIDMVQKYDVTLALKDLRDAQQRVDAVENLSTFEFAHMKGVIFIVKKEVIALLHDGKVEVGKKCPFLVDEIVCCNNFAKYRFCSLESTEPTCYLKKKSKQQPGWKNEWDDAKEVYTLEHVQKILDVVREDAVYDDGDFYFKVDVDKLTKTVHSLEPLRSRPRLLEQKPGCYLTCPFDDLCANDVEKINEIERQSAYTAMFEENKRMLDKVESALNERYDKSEQYDCGYRSGLMQVKVWLKESITMTTGDGEG
jgi:hypothetical protein